MGDTIKCVSDHAEDLADGRTVPPGLTASNVDLDDPVNERLLNEQKIIVLDAEESEGEDQEQILGSGEPPSEEEGS